MLIALRNSTARTAILIMTMMLMFGSLLTISADVNISINSNDKMAIEDAIKKASKANSGSEESSTSVVVKSKDNTKDGSNKATLFIYDGANTLIFKNDEFNRANIKETKKAMEAFINTIKDSSLSVDTQQSIMTQIQESNSDVAAMMIPLIFDNSKADLFTAYKWLYPFLQVLRVVFGLGAVFIILLLIRSTIMDLAYVGLPMWREVHAEKASSQGHSASKKPFGVSFEALSTVQEVEKNIGEYKNAYIVYGKRRAMTYIVLSICLLYLIVGELGGLISWVLSLASGIVQ